jgi:hypothetical protein
MSYIPEGYFIDKGYTFGLEQMFRQKFMTKSMRELADEKLAYNVLRDTFLECEKGASKQDIKKVLYKNCDKEIDAWYRKVLNDPRFKDCCVHRDENQILILFGIANALIDLDGYVDFLDVEVNQ